MSETTPFESWAILELMGHRQRPGFVREVEIANGKLLRVDIPTPTGDVTEFYGISSVYALRPCTEEIARQAAKYQDPRPIKPVSYRPDDERRQTAIDYEDDD